jgi:hypothetical protein
MSVITEAYAVPSRLLGIYRFLLRIKSQGESLDVIEKTLSPESLVRPDDGTGQAEREGGGREMVRKTVNECVAMGLFVQEDGTVRVNPALPDDARKPDTAEAAAPVTLSRLIFAADRDANHDLGKQVAWYLAQDALDAPGTWPETEKSITERFGDDRLGLTNNLRYGNFEDWVCFLGFGWMHMRGGKSVLTPDPTPHLKLRLAEVLPGKPNTRHPLPEVMGRLAQLCPAFEGGFLRAEIDRVFTREPGTLSSTTALAWLRLRDEGLVELTQESDAATLLLPDGDRVEPVSHVVLRPVA